VEGIKRILELYVRSLHHSIDITTAVLLLTGQLSIRSVVFASDEFRLSLTGPILGGDKTVGRNSTGAPFVLDAINAVTAFLLILGEIQTVGIFVQSRRLSLLVTGPPFGTERTETYVPGTERFFAEYRQRILQKFEVRERDRGGE
jgi:hypothetical protein